MAGGVREMVTWGEVAGRPDWGGARGLNKSGYVVPFEAPGQRGEYEQSTDVGFRCARDV
jgi:hypothetical protein